LVPDSLRADVPGVDLPPPRATAGDVLSALDGQTGRLEVANTNKRASLEIVEACEKRDAATVRHLTRRWFEFWK
jgi:hypothetical protein